MRVAYFGSGPFGLETLDRLAGHHEVVLVVTQPDRPAGRNRKLQATVIAKFALDLGIPTIKPENANAPEVIDEIRAAGAEAFVVIAFGQKLGPDLLGDTFAINLHASLLPKYRGAAPINWAMINQERQTGVSVITLADRMDAGDILAAASTRIDPGETAGELHDRLAGLGPDVVLDVLASHENGTLKSVVQDESKATKAPKLSKADGTVDFNQSASGVRSRIHGLTPWPGCTVRVDDRELKLLRAGEVADTSGSGSDVEAGQVLEDLTVACAEGRLQLRSVQPPGGKAMSFAAYANGHDIRPGMRILPR